jgi:G:T-mismatch repair DNA endonuclease (very short patch repair protein)
LAEIGWNVLTIWECELRNSVSLARKLASFLANHPPAC